MNLVQKAAALMARADVVVLSSVSGDGYPRPCALSKIRAEGAHSFYVATGALGVKAAHFRKSPKAGA
ncbi:MAG: pyridoxamine 5'-phosphate oxidase family protein, partial [Clostridiales bacterium]|nr:pyridoxamine 5'-phosphate oxidase family protein [Clostridiales bacterium]